MTNIAWPVEAEEVPYPHGILNKVTNKNEAGLEDGSRP